MRAVLISIQPKWCELIASGKKMVEVRKTKPKLKTPFKCYIYCTNVKGRAFFTKGENGNYAPARLGNGKIIGEFVCDQIDEIGYSPEMHGKYISDIDDIHYVSCVDFEEMFEYLADGYGYGWHISDLVIYDNPKDLNEFFYACDKPQGTDCSVCFDRREYKCKAITRPPQSWMYVEVEQ